MIRRNIWGLIAVLGLVGCGGENAQDRVESVEDWGAPAARVEGGPMNSVAREYLAEASEAYRQEDYDAALELYRRAAAEAPGNPAPLLGIDMTATAMGDEELADSAKQAMNRTVPGGIGR